MLDTSTGTIKKTVVMAPYYQTDFSNRHIYDIKLECSKEPTFYSKTGRLHIDLFLISDSINIDNCQSLGDSPKIADFHRAVILLIQLTARPNPREN